MNSTPSVDQVRERVDAIYHDEAPRILATLIRMLGDFDLAEDAVQEAFRAAMEQWPQDGIPQNPQAWLVSTGRFKAIDALRKRSRVDPLDDALIKRLATEPFTELHDEDIEDDRLRLIFTCCHPALLPDARVALTLREVCGLTTEAIAHAFLTAPATLAQRIVRAKAKIREEQIPYEAPSQPELPDRLEAVLQVIYLVYNEGYSAARGEALTRPDLSGEAIRLGRLLVEHLPEPEAIGLLALMLLHEARRPARTSPEGEMVLLEDQDRSLWNRQQIAEGYAFLRAALLSGRVGAYTLQAAIAAAHTAASSIEATNWAQIVRLYDTLLRLTPSPIIEVNRAVAVAMRDGPEMGLALIEDILGRGDLADYHPVHSARAELCRRLSRTDEARASYQEALRLAQQEPEKRLIEKRLASLKT